MNDTLNTASYALSDDDLDSVAGGVSFSQKYIVTLNSKADYTKAVKAGVWKDDGSMSRICTSASAARDLVADLKRCGVNAGWSIK